MAAAEIERFETQGPDTARRPPRPRRPRPADGSLTLSTVMLGPGVAQVRLRGALDCRTYDALADGLDALIRRGTVRLVLDCAAVEAISTVGAAACVVAAGHAQDRGGNLVLLRPSAAVRALVDVLGLDALFPRADDLPGALRHLPPPAGAAPIGPGIP